MNDGTIPSSAESKLVRTPDGTKRWYVGSQLHRTDGPAFEGIDGTKMWMQHGRLHREDGPAMIHPDGKEEFYIAGEHLEKQAFIEMQARIAAEAKAAERREAERKQKIIDDAHAKAAAGTQDKLREAAKENQKFRLPRPPKP
jgi:hypothetical protein